MAVVPVVLVLLLAMTVGAAVAAARRAPASREAAVAAARRHGLAVAVAAPVAGVGVALWLLWAAADVGRGFPGSISDALVLIPLAYATAHTAVLALGELTWPRPEGTVRRARLVRRRLADVAPRRLTRLLAAGTVVLVAGLIAGAALDDPDGRSVSFTDGPLTRTHGPWPGGHYNGPLAVELVLLVLALTAALWLVVHRPAVATDDERIESALRRASAHRVLRGATAGVLLLAGWVVSAVGVGLASVEAAPGLVGTVSGLAGTLAELLALGILCLPAPPVPAGAPAVPAR